MITYGSWTIKYKTIKTIIKIKLEDKGKKNER